ncbi:uncharacterized protein RJT20DRAFT_47708 [Scheffersomyces xylosifermentans]|uniref:uncharacterized protein n=1 Tax=Scheffersomyces xylosifermentans TaxID=1304137 RepID=UPI00315DE7B4
MLPIGSIPSFLLVSALLSLVLATPPSSNPPRQLSWYDKPILEITSRTHDRRLISQLLYKSYEEYLTLVSSNRSPMHVSNDKINSDRECIENTVIRYFLKDIKYITKQYEASECRINTNNKYKSVLQPTPNIHVLVHETSDTIQKQLETKIELELQKNDKFKDTKFYNFENLDYSIECLIGYQEIAQVKMEENDIEAMIEKIVEIPDACSFQKVKHDFDGKHYETIKIDLPLNGTLYCRRGRSSTCNRANSEYKNSRFKVPI